MRKVFLAGGLSLLAFGILLPLAVEGHKLVWNFTHQPEIIARWGKAPLEWLINNPFYVYANRDGFDLYMSAVFVGLISAALGAGLALCGLPKEKRERTAD